MTNCVNLNLTSDMDFTSKQPVVLLKRISDTTIEHYVAPKKVKEGHTEFTEDWQSCVSKQVASKQGARQAEYNEGNSSDPDTEPYVSDSETIETSASNRLSSAVADSTTTSGRNTPSSDSGINSDSWSSSRRGTSNTASPDTNAPHLGALRRPTQRIAALELDIYSSLNVMHSISDSEDPKMIVEEYAKLFEKCVNLLHEISPRARDLVLKAFCMKEEVIKQIFQLLKDLAPGRSGCDNFIEQMQESLKALMANEEEEENESDSEEFLPWKSIDMIEGAEPKSIHHIISVVNEPKLEELLGLTFEKRIQRQSVHIPPPYHHPVVRDEVHFYRGPGRPMHRFPGARSPVPPQYRNPTDIRLAYHMRMQHQQRVHQQQQIRHQQQQIAAQQQLQQRLQQQRLQQHQNQRLQEIQQQRLQQHKLAQQQQHQRSSPAQVMADMVRLAGSHSPNMSSPQHQKAQNVGRHGAQIPVSAVQQQMQRAQVTPRNSGLQNSQTTTPRRLGPQTTLTPNPPPLVPSSSVESKKASGPISITLPSGISITPIETAPPKEKTPPRSNPVAQASKSDLQIIPVQKPKPDTSSIVAKLNPGITLTPIGGSSGAAKPSAPPTTRPSLTAPKSTPVQSALSAQQQHLLQAQRAPMVARANGTQERPVNWMQSSRQQAPYNRQIPTGMMAPSSSTMVSQQRPSSWTIPPVGTMHVVPGNGVMPGYMVQTFQGPQNLQPQQVNQWMMQQQHYK